MGKKNRHRDQPERQREPTRVLYTPSWVVELGNCLYIADREGDFASKTYATNVLEQYEAYRKNFNPDSPRRVYLDKLFLIAESVAGGKKRRREEYRDDFTSLAEDRKLRTEETKDRDKRYTHWIDSWLPKALSFSGGFCLTKAVFEGAIRYFDLEGPAVEPIGWWLSAAAATGAPSVLRGVQSKIFYSRLKGIEKDFKEQRKQLRELLKNSMQDEYRIAIDRAQHAWRESFGELPNREKEPKNHVKFA